MFDTGYFRIVQSFVCNVILEITRRGLRRRLVTINSQPPSTRNCNFFFLWLGNYFIRINSLYQELHEIPILSTSRFSSKRSFFWEMNIVECINLFNPVDHCICWVSIRSLCGNRRWAFKPYDLGIRLKDSRTRRTQSSGRKWLVITF